MKINHCDHCGREFGQRDYDANIGARWSHDTQSNQAYQAELCCDCLEKLMTRYMEEMTMTTMHGNKTICAACGREFDNTHDYQVRVGGNVPKIRTSEGGCVCRDCFDSRAARFVEACAIKPKAVPWINSEMCAWQKDMENRVNAHD